MIDIHAAWNNATQEWEASIDDLPNPCLRAQTLPALREAITRLFGPDGDHPFRLIVLARNRETRNLLH